MNKSRFKNIYLVFMFVILYLPIAYLIFYSFNEGGDMLHFTGFTWKHYQSLFGDTRLWVFFLNTFIIAFLSSALATIIGSLGAISLYFSKRARRQQLLNLNNVLIVMPDVMMGASFLVLFSMFLPVPLGFWSVLLSHVAFSIPIVVLMVLPKLYEMNKNMITAARDLGANDLQILFQIILPNLTRGILSGFFMAFTYSLDDFAVTFFVTGNGFSTLSVEIYSRARMGISLEINALTTIMFLLCLAMVVGYYYLQVGERPSLSNRFKRGEGVN